MGFLYVNECIPGTVYAIPNIYISLHKDPEPLLHMAHSLKIICKRVQIIIDNQIYIS